jgi:hypothetical protein
VWTQKSRLIYKDKNASIEQRVDDLLQNMTLEEKMVKMN